MTALLELGDVRAGYGETTVLRGVTLSVDTGEVVAVVGRNGVGKTTTLRTIVGAVRPWDGTIRFDNEDITGLAPEDTVARGIGYVPEERRILPGLTVEENLRLASYGGSEGTAGRTVGDVLETFEQLGARRTSRGADLSGGEQQMLAIARALVAGSELLLLDEPTEGLAPMIVERVATLVDELHEQGLTLLLVEQNVAVALDLADRVYVIDRGEVVYEGRPAELRTKEDILDRYLGVTVAG